MTIDEYVAAVRRELGPGAHGPELADLRATLKELTAFLGSEQAACTELGDPRDYAHELHGGDEPAEPPRFLGMPNTMGVPLSESMRPEAWARMFDPSDSRILYPKTSGLGWSMNFGALLVRMHLLRPDDVGSDVMAELRARDVALTFGWPALALVTTAVTAWWGSNHLQMVPTHWGNSRPDIFSDARQTFAMYLGIETAACLLGAVAAGLLIRVRKVSAALVVAAVTTWFTVFFTGPVLMGLSGDRAIGWVAGVFAVGALLIALVSPLPALRSAIRRLWRKQGRAA